MSAYLMSYFTGERFIEGEQIYFAVSEDGFHWTDLNQGKPILRSESGKTGLRDPFLFKSPIDGIYYILATDLRIWQSRNWSEAVEKGSTKMAIFKSRDLVRWSEMKLVDLAPEGAGCLWAPKAVYDEKREAMMILFTSFVRNEAHPEGKHAIYRVFTKDFITFTEPLLYFQRSNDVIDMAIIKNEGQYYRFYKDEVTKHIRIDRSEDVDGHFEVVANRILDDMAGLEGPALFYHEEKEKWCLLVDQFLGGKGYLPMIIESFEEDSFRILAGDEYDFGRTIKRHGSICKISERDKEALEKAYTQKNPILPGLYADPDILFDQDRYYLFPTTDGHDDWSGTSFSVFSSEDMTLWTEEGVILDLAMGDVSWTSGSAWAPTIAKIKNKYLFYFCGRHKDGQMCIGAAEADKPAGPYTAMEAPMITPEMVASQDISIGQVIDPAYYEEEGIPYMLFGNCAPIIVRLSEDGKSIIEDTMQVLEGAVDFREAIDVFKKDGRYHFCWSCDDTRSENYHVKYGISDKLTGPIEYLYPVLQKEPSKDILGTGHHRMFLNPKDDQYYMLYHRFGTPTSAYKSGQGYRREIAIDKVRFDNKGRILPVKVTK